MPHLLGDLHGREPGHRDAVQAQVPPLLPVMIKALIGISLYHREFGFAAVVALGYHCILRTTEFLTVGSHNFQLDGQFVGIVALGFSKSGKRTGIQEMVTIEDGVVGYLCYLACTHSSNSTRLFPESATKFRAMFEHYLVLLGLGSQGFKPYSIRRGGATFDFVVHKNFERTMIRGRWQAVKTARIYINEALAEYTQLRIPESATRTVQYWASQVAAG